MTTQIAITISEPFLTVEEFSRRIGMPINTVRGKISSGQFPIRKKISKAGKSSRETPLINMVALVLEGAAAYKGNIVLNVNNKD